MKHYLFTPGPTPVPPRVRKSEAGEIIHHRSAEFASIMREVEKGLKEVFQTSQDVLIFASSGTGVMEAAVANLLSPQDKAIVIRGGKFGERWQELCETFGVRVVPLEFEYGEAPSSEDVARLLQENPDTRAVFTTLLETSTATMFDIERIARVVKETNAALVVDGVSGIGACPLRMDEWRVDCLVGASQKAFMLPPGLGFVALSDKAWKMVETSRLPKYYFDFLKYRKLLQGKGQTPYTTPVSLVYGLKEALSLILEEGLDKALERHRRLSRGVREAVSALGLEIFSRSPANGVTAVKIPEEIGAKKLKGHLAEKYGVEVAGGQGELADKIIRISNLGYVGEKELRIALSSLEKALADLGDKKNKGNALKAFERALRG